MKRKLDNKFACINEFTVFKLFPKNLTTEHRFETKWKCAIQTHVHIQSNKDITKMHTNIHAWWCPHECFRNCVFRTITIWQMCTLIYGQMNTKTLKISQTKQQHMGTTISIQQSFWIRIQMCTTIDQINKIHQQMQQIHVCIHYCNRTMFSTVAFECCWRNLIFK